MPGVGAPSGPPPPPSTPSVGAAGKDDAGGFDDVLLPCPPDVGTAELPPDTELAPPDG